MGNGNFILWDLGLLPMVNGHYWKDICLPNEIAQYRVVNVNYPKANGSLINSKWYTIHYPNGDFMKKVLIATLALRDR